MTKGADKRLGFSVTEGRTAKAEKIAAILAAAGRPLVTSDNVLDLGCGNGEIAEYLSADCRMSCADAADQRTHGLKLPFHIVGTLLPFPDASFDVVLSNHVIEHTPDPDTHVREIRRILKPEGVAYLATPNRLWPWEVHARLPMIHYLPWRLFSGIGKALGRLHEPVRLLTPRGLRQAACERFSVQVWHHKILSDPGAYALSLPDWLNRLLRATPRSLLKLTAAIQPTLIVLLNPK